MTVVRSLVAALIVTGFAALPASAQDAQPAPADQQQPVAPAEPALPEPEPSHLAAAVEFLRVSGSTKGFEEMIPQFLDQVRARFVAQRPEIAQLINDTSFSLIPDFVARRDDLNAALGKLYAAKFTEEELVQLTAFYKAPLGQKLATEQVKIVSESIPIVQKWSRKLTDDMITRIKDEVAKKGQKL